MVKHSYDRAITHPTNQPIRIHIRKGMISTSNQIHYTNKDIIFERSKQKNAQIFTNLATETPTITVWDVPSITTLISTT